jgi:hypothetical protein
MKMAFCHLLKLANWKTFDYSQRNVSSENQKKKKHSDDKSSDVSAHL